MQITIEQCRAARAILNWSANELAVAAGLGIATVKRFEVGQNVKEASVALMRAAIEKAGVNFIMPEDRSIAGGVGVRLSKERSKGS